MIAKPYSPPAGNKDRKQRAGEAAERQMAHYLHRSFNDREDVFVLNGLRLVDPEQPEQDGSPGVCQIDHLVLHRWGFFIIESKSVSGEVRIQSDGSGGDEWIRVYGDKEKGMPSPLRQAKRQADFLRSFMQRHRQELLDKEPPGRRAVTRLAIGTDYEGFQQAPIQLIVAISDKGKIERGGRWEELNGRFPSYVKKADLVSDTIQREMDTHRNRASGRYGMWDMEVSESARIVDLLRSSHVDPPPLTPPPPPPAPTQPPSTPQQGHRKWGDILRGVIKGGTLVSHWRHSCKHCGSAALVAQYGKYGYYWKCGTCGKNTTMPRQCNACGANNKDQVRIRKSGPNYSCDCEACGASAIIWTERRAQASK